MMAIAATNISFLYFLEHEFNTAEMFADVAIRHNRYNGAALVNKGNCLFVAGNLEKAKDYFLEAIGIEATSIEAIYNLALVYKHLGHYEQAL